VTRARIPVTAVSDRRRAMPRTAGARRDVIGIALASLREEERRLERLGLAPALARCRAERRYWQFLDAVHRSPGSSPTEPGEFPWPARAGR
jgi:hypothetical protein